MKQNESKLEDNYIIGKTLGEGSFGVVKKVTHKITKELRALKIININLLNE